MRWNHIIGGQIIFGLGLFSIYCYSPQVVEVFKGAIQPLIIALGLTALAAAFFGKQSARKFNAPAAGLFLALGGYGLYDEYYAVLDFFNGFIPLLLLVIGVVAVVCGIRKVN